MESCQLGGGGQVTAQEEWVTLMQWQDKWSILQVSRVGTGLRATHNMHSRHYHGQL